MRLSPTALFLSVQGFEVRREFVGELLSLEGVPIQPDEQGD
jgi:hypothetical protein